MSHKKDYELDIIGDGGAQGTAITSQYVQGDVAHDDVDSGNPVKIGGVARTSQQTEVQNGDRVQSVFDKYGQLVLAGVDWVSELNGFINREDRSHTEVVTELNGTVTVSHWLYVGDSEWLAVYWAAPATGTLKIWSSVQNDGSAYNAGTRLYADRSFGGIEINNGVTPATSYTNSIEFGTDCRGVEWIRLDIVVSAGSYKLVGNKAKRF